MATQITLGNMFTSNGKTVMTGGSSGLDVESMVNSLADAKRLPAKALEDKISTNTTRSTAYSEMKQLLTDFRDAAENLRNPPGVRNSADNIFEYRSATVTSNTGVAGSAYLNVTTEPGTNTGTYAVTVGSIATQSVFTTNTFAAADMNASVVGSSPQPFNAGNLVLGASGTSITLSSGDSLGQVIAKINAKSDQSKVQATAIKVSNGNYQISFKSTETGANMNYNITALNAGVMNVGIGYSQTAVNSSITIDGTTVTRSSNSIDDVIDGVTFDLVAQTPVATTLEMDIIADTDLAKQGIMNFVDAYNALRLFVSRQSELGSDGKPTEDAVLANDNTMQLTMSRINAEMADVVEGVTSGDPARLSDLGITYDDFAGDDTNPFTRNILVVDEDKLNSALQSDFDAVRKVFEFDYSSDNANLQVFSRTNGLDVTAVTLNINQTTGTYQATYTLNGVTQTVNVDKEQLNSSSILLKGQNGTALEGLTLIFSSTSNATVHLNMSQGIGDRVFNAIDDLLDEDVGAITNALTKIEDDETRYQKEIDKIDATIEKFRQQLLDKFAALEKAVSQANSLLQSIQANVDASNNA